MVTSSVRWRRVHGQPRGLGMVCVDGGGEVMKELRDMFMMLCFSAIPISGFISVALLIYYEKKGWGWLLVVVLLIADSIRIKTGD